ncbi:CBS domain-containing protein [Actinoplanes sp. NPDC051851]|uniref:CBS domain-containing protein n=1 Tax=Actinoplanes sp. NPDC051851 TaxID=3154753 RepID=UPI003429F832
MRVRDIMSSPVFTVAPGAPVAAAAETVTEHGITALPVVDEAGRLIGMVSEGDLLRHRVPEDPTAHILPRAYPEIAKRPESIAEVMTGSPLTTWPGADVADVAEAMLRHDVRSLPVIEEGAVVGIVSRRDILRAVIRSDGALATEVQHRFDEYGDGEGRWNATVTDGVVTVHGAIGNDTERAVLTVLARTVPGVTAVHLAGAA